MFSPLAHTANLASSAYFKYFSHEYNSSQNYFNNTVTVEYTEQTIIIFNNRVMHKYS